MNLNKEQVWASLPPQWDEDTMPGILAHLKNSRTTVVILDDDPTGTQTVHGIPVLTVWDVDSLAKELSGHHKAFFILTNSRGLTTDHALALAKTVGSNLKQAAGRANVNVSVISRSDSTLRGHFPGEVDEIARAMGNEGLPYLVCPFFLEGGRYTINNIHYVEQDCELVPAADTPYAKDASFGFTRSNLCEWVEEKTRGRIRACQVVPVTLEDIRTGGPQRVCSILTGVKKGGACIVNAVSYKDMEVFVLGLLKARSQGKHFLYRTAASFVRVRTGISPRPFYLDKKELLADTRNGGLFVVGSYVPKTTAQLDQLLKIPDVTPVEVDVRQLLDPLQNLSAVRAAALDVNRAVSSGRDTVVYTSRELVRSNDPEKSLEIGQTVSQSLIRIIRMLDCRPGYLVAKGGITSSDVATVALEARRAMISGQVLPGVPVWQLGEESVYPGMSYIIFPGNVGADDGLVAIQKKLRQKGRLSHA